MPPGFNRTSLTATGKAGLHGLPIKIIQKIFSHLEKHSRVKLARTARRFYVALQASLTPAPPSPSQDMWDVYAEIAYVKRLILEHDKDPETIKLVLAHKSRGVLQRNKVNPKLVFEYRQAAQWKKIDKQLQKAKTRKRIQQMLEELAQVDEVDEVNEVNEVEEIEEVQELSIEDQRVQKWLEKYPV